jgi:hypothetical protein
VTEMTVPSSWFRVLSRMAASIRSTVAAAWDPRPVSLPNYRSAITESGFQTVDDCGLHSGNRHRRGTAGCATVAGQRRKRLLRRRPFPILVTPFGCDSAISPTLFAQVCNLVIAQRH